jgi:predicted esterase
VKNLQDLEVKTRELQSKFKLTVVERRPETPKSILLLLHGLDERGLRIYRKLIKFLPEHTLVLAPNAPFPLPRPKPDRTDYGYTWYFYDRFSQDYEVNQSFALSLLTELIRLENPTKLPVSIIGFSQGGYLAPLLGYEVAETERVIGIGCEFRHYFFKSPPHFKLSAFHGAKDQIIPAQNAKNEIDLLKEKEIDVSWHLIENAKHEITAEMGIELKKLLES